MRKEDHFNYMETQNTQTLYTHEVYIVKEQLHKCTHVKKLRNATKTCLFFFLNNIFELTDI